MTDRPRTPRQTIHPVEVALMEVSREVAGALLLFKHTKVVGWDTFGRKAARTIRLSAVIRGGIVALFGSHPAGMMKLPACRPALGFANRLADPIRKFNPLLYAANDLADVAEIIERYSLRKFLCSSCVDGGK